MGRKRTLSDTQVIQALHAWNLRHGRPPTVEELRKHLGVGSTRTVTRYLNWLEEAGAIERWPGARGLKLLKVPGAGVETKLVPIVGEATAGALQLAEESREGAVHLPKGFLSPPSAKFFLLRVRGDSMNRARIDKLAIENGDLVVVRQQATADSGAIVVALVDGEATIKRLIRGPGYFILRPESKNPQHQPIMVTNDFSIQGVVSKVLKKGSDYLKVVEH